MAGVLQALIRWRVNGITGLYGVPYDTETEGGVTKDFPLGRWVHQQRKALRTGEPEERRKELPDAPAPGTHALRDFRASSTMRPARRTGLAAPTAAR